MGKPASSALVTALTACLLALGSVACSDDGIDSDEEARRAYLMSSAIEGDAVLNLTFSGPLRNNGSGGAERVPGSTTVTGKASTGDGTYTVSLTI